MAFESEIKKLANHKVSLMFFKGKTIFFENELPLSPSRRAKFRKVLARVKIFKGGEVAVSGADPIANLCKW